jgi:hypothetical protein
MPHCGHRVTRGCSCLVFARVGDYLFTVVARCSAPLMHCNLAMTTTTIPVEVDHTLLPGIFRRQDDLEGASVLKYGTLFRVYTAQNSLNQGSLSMYHGNIGSGMLLLLPGCRSSGGCRNPSHSCTKNPEMSGTRCCHVSTSVDKSL